MNYKLEHIVREFLIESYGAYQIDSRYARVMQIATSGLREIHMDVGARKNLVMLDINDNDTVPLPIDYIDYFKVGICLNGQIIGLTENPHQCPPSLDDCGNVKAFNIDTNKRSDTPDFFVGFSSYDSYNKDGQRIGRNYGLGGGGALVGTFKVFEDEGYMVVRGNGSNDAVVGNQIVLEYLAHLPRDADGMLTVHPYDVEAIKAWIHWKYIQRLRSTPGGMADEARRLYGIEKKKSRMRHNAMTPAEVVEAVRKGYKSSPKI
jgi:hypothetical protein